MQFSVRSSLTTAHKTKEHKQSLATGCMQIEPLNDVAEACEERRGRRGYMGSATPTEEEINGTEIKIDPQRETEQCPKQREHSDSHHETSKLVLLPGEDNHDAEKPGSGSGSESKSEVEVAEKVEELKYGSG
jgi:hypothetical protein